MSRFAQLAVTLEAHQAAGHWRGVLLEVTNAVIAAFQDPRAKAVVFGSPELDHFCLWAGSAAAAMLPPAPEAPGNAPYDENLVVYLATELLKNQGGHTPALQDVIQARPQGRHVVLLSNLHDKPATPEDLPALKNADGSPVQIIPAPPGDLGQKTVWLLMALRQLRPGRLVLFNHHYDSAIIAAAQPSAARQTVYFHHCDIDCALGVYLPHARHVDCSNIMHERCRVHLGVPDPAYWPLTAADRGARDTAHPYMGGARGLLTCSHGSPTKFLSLGRYAYFDVMRRRLAELPGCHIHVGPLPEGTVAQFRQTLEQADIDPSRFEHVAPVPSLWAWLRESAVDLVISSFPVQGGRGLVETFGAGLPVLGYDGSLSRLHASLDPMYPEVLRWRTPDEMMAVLKSLTPELLATQARAARAHYENWHHPRELAYAVNNPRLTAPVPPTAPFVPDTLALYWR